MEEEKLLEAFLKANLAERARWKPAGVKWRGRESPATQAVEKERANRRSAELEL